MKSYGFIEVSGVVAAVDALDVMCKSSNVEFVAWERKLGGRMVTVTVNGKFEMVDIHLDPICVDNRDIKMLEDLIVAAQHDAVSNMQQLIQEKAGPMFSGMNIPGLNL